MISNQYYYVCRVIALTLEQFTRMGTTAFIALLLLCQTGESSL